MTSRPETFAAIVLAAQRAGVIDPLAAASAVSHKCLVPIVGEALIAHVVAALQATPGLSCLRIVVEPDAVEAVRRVLPAGTVEAEFIAAADNLADSVRAAASRLDGRMIVTTADNVLLTSGAVTAMIDTLATVDIAIAMARKDSVMAAHPEGQRRYYRFTDDEYSNCNLYGFGSAKAVAAAESFRGGGQFAKKPMRIVAAFGLLNLVLLATRRLSLDDALRRVGRRFGLTAAPVILADGAHAIDVDNARTYAVAEQLLSRRTANADAERHGRRVRIGQQNASCAVPTPV